MIEVLIKPVLELVFGLVNHLKKRPRLKLESAWCHEPNGNGVGTFLALAVKITNLGPDPIFFERIEATTEDGETFYPLFFLVKPGAQIAPMNNLVGLIPCGHVRYKGIQEIRVIDATERVHMLRGKRLLVIVKDLSKEMSRLEALGFSVNPVSPYPN